MKIEAVIAALGTVFGAEDSAVTERVLREYNGPLPSRLLKSQHHPQRGLSSASIPGRGDTHRKRHHRGIRGEMARRHMTRPARAEQ
jgi:hypothetical protein